MPRPATSVAFLCLAVVVFTAVVPAVAALFCAVLIPLPELVPAPAGACRFERGTPRAESTQPLHAADPSRGPPLHA